MNYKETKGLGYLICIIIYGGYILFDMYPIIFWLLIIIFIIYIYIKIFYFKKEKNILNENNVYIDKRGYERDKFNHRLIHRNVAYKEIYDSKKYSKRFSEYIIHHIDGNKRNNQKDNLKILTKEEHKIIHQF